MAYLGRVLVVDDDHDIVEGICIRLHAAGYEVMVIYDGQQCVANAIRYQPDAILLDMRMPNMDGISVLAQLKQLSDTQAIPVVMLSASLVNRQAALRAGASFFIVKPYERLDLLAALKSVIQEKAKAPESAATG